MTNQQLYLAIGVPLLFNAGFFGLLIALLNSKFDAKFLAIDARFKAIDARFDAIERRLDGLEKRIDDMKELWRAELRRVEEVLDARLRHLEERL